MKKCLPLLLILSCLFLYVKAQTILKPAKTFRIGIFSPLYLDSVFSGSTYNYGKSFPKFAQQGFDFVQGAQIALDSMHKFGGNIEAFIFDSKAVNEPITQLISTKKLDSIDLLIGAVKDAEFLQLAAFARQKNIPFISASYPNDGGVTQNPFLVIMNSTLKAHCETIFSYLVQNHGTDKIYLCRRKGSQEDKIAEYFKAINETDKKPILKIEVLNLDDDLISLKNKIDSTTTSVIIGGSLNETFATGLSDATYALSESFKVELIGMPNWDGFSELKKARFKDLPIIFTTPYLNNKSDSYSKKIKQVYSTKYKGVPSDMTYKGFETTFLFSGLLSKYPDDFFSHLNESSLKVFNEYNFKPVYINKKSTLPDYFENKHLYFMKILNGKIVTSN